MQISFNTEDLTDLDRQVLAVLAGDAAPASDAPAQEATKAEKPAPAAKKAAPAPKAAKPAPEPETEEETPEEEPEETGDAPTKEQAIEMATKLVAGGEAAKVKAALTEVGAKKVSELTDDNVAEFIAKISA